MRRRNLRQAFIGEGDPDQEGLEVEGEGQEEVEFRVEGGHVAVVVPPGTPDEDVFDRLIFVHAELTLENGSRVTFGVHADTVGGRISVTGPKKGTDAESDLSAASVVTQGDAV